jgi:hypothetical protein
VKWPTTRQNGKTCTTVNSTTALPGSVNFSVVVLRLFAPCTAIQGRVELNGTAERVPPAGAEPVPPGDEEDDVEPAAPAAEAPDEPVTPPTPAVVPVTAPPDDPCTDGAPADGVVTDVVTDGVVTPGVLTGGGAVAGAGAGGGAGGFTGGTVTDGTVTVGTVTVGTDAVGIGTGTCPRAVAAPNPPSADASSTSTAVFTLV